MSPGVVDCAFVGFAQQGFHCGERLLDRVEVRRVRRQEKELGAGGSDGFADSLAFMAAEVDGVDAPLRHHCAKVVSLMIT